MTFKNAPIGFPQRAATAASLSFPSLVVPSGEFLCIDPLPESNKDQPTFLPGDQTFAFEMLGNLWEDFSTISSSAAASSYQLSMTLRIIGQSRTNYLDGLEEIKKLYIANGHKVSKEIALRHAQLRELMRQSVRRELSPLGFRAWYPLDLMRDRIRAFYGKMSVWERIDNGFEQKVIESSYKANQYLGRNFVRSTRAASRILGAGSLLFFGLEVSETIHRLNTASTPKEFEDTLESLVTVTTTATFATICAVATIGSAGILSVVACGVLPVIGGIAVGKAARSARDALDKQEYSIKRLLSSFEE